MSEVGRSLLSVRGRSRCATANLPTIKALTARQSTASTVSSPLATATFLKNDTDAAHVGGDNPTLRGYGGAIYTDRSNNSIAITKSTFDGNRSKASGGAVHLFADPEDVVTIDSSVFTNNQSTGLPGGNDGGKGGAIAQIRSGAGGTFTISNSTIANNTGFDQGGGLWVYNSPTTISNSTFSGNKIVGNGFGNVGGGMTLYSDTEIINTTIANNSAGWVGGGISAVDSAKVSVKNTIFYKNTADNGTQHFGIEQHTTRELIDNGGNIQFPSKKTNLGNDFNATAKIRLVDPKLSPLKDNGGGIPTHALLAGSPAINTGIGSGAPTIDERGFKRSDGKVDIGAFEFGAGSSTTRSSLTRGIKTRSLTRSADLGTGSTGSTDLLTGGLGALIKDRASGELHRPTQFFNAGTVEADSLTNAVKAAYADKGQQKAGNQKLATHEAVFFQMGSRAYLSVNDNQRGFNGDRDLVLDLTGVNLCDFSNPQRINSQ